MYVQQNLIKSKNYTPDYPFEFVGPSAMSI